MRPHNPHYDSYLNTTPHRREPCRDSASLLLPLSLSLPDFTSYVLTSLHISNSGCIRAAGSADTLAGCCLRLVSLRIGVDALGLQRGLVKVGFKCISVGKAVHARAVDRIIGELAFVTRPVSEVKQSLAVLLACGRKESEFWCKKL